MRLLLALLVLPATLIFAQTEAGQTVGGITTETEPLTVQNGTEELISITAGSTSVMVNAEQALAVTDWIKREAAGRFDEIKNLKLNFTGEQLVVVLVPENGPSKELELSKHSARLFGAALATARQNGRFPAKE